MGERRDEGVKLNGKREGNQKGCEREGSEDKKTDWGRRMCEKEMKEKESDEGKRGLGKAESEIRKERRRRRIN